MASLDLLSHALSTDLLQSESLHEALNKAEGLDAMASIMDETLDRVESVTPQPPSAPEGPDPGSNGGQSPGRVGRFLGHLKRLVVYVHELEPPVRQVCELAFVYIERVYMKYLATSSRWTGAVKQAWPVESAQIESILTSVKEEMENVEEDFNKAMLVIQQAVDSQNTLERTQALRRYEVMMSDIQPVFDTCLQYVKQAEATLETLKPKVENTMDGSQKKAVMASGYTGTAAGITALTITGAWMVAAPVALAITGGCFWLSFHQRHELRGDLEYYNSKIMLAMKINTMKKRLNTKHAFLLDLIKKSE
ncbi:uncharacterized protein LOC144872478 isoform X2 [Branchiostoma floridae x Branchiostoma japonicum]